MKIGISLICILATNFGAAAIWDDSSSDWATPNNWLPPIVPANGSTLVFRGNTSSSIATNNDLNISNPIFSIQFDYLQDMPTSYTLTGNTFYPPSITVSPAVTTPQTIQ